MFTRSAKLSAQAKLESLIEVDRADDSEEETSEDEEDGYSSLDSDYGGGGAKKRGTKVPPTKRARVSVTKQPSPVKKTPRGRKNLSLLPTMPLDVLFEIFGLLRPKDIISLSRTNKVFRETLMSKNAITVWKKTIKKSGAPDCPNDMTEPKWAALIFGNMCQSCNAKNIQKVDFFLRRRVCTLCKKKNLVTETKFKSSYPDLEKSILDLIPHTNVGGWAHGHASGTRFFWSGDIEAMVKKLAVLQHDIHMRRVDAQKKLDQFVLQQKQFVESVVSSAQQYQNYLENIVTERVGEGYDARNKRQVGILERLVELGYTPEDVYSCRNHADYNRKTDLTDRIWMRIRPILEPLVLESKTRRLERELSDLKKTRRKIVHELYTKYQQTLRPAQWLYLPRTYEICQMLPFLQFINLPYDVEVVSRDFEEPMSMLPELLSKYMDEKRSSRLQMIPTVATNSSAEIPLLTRPPTPDPLELAISVFRCRSYSHLGTIVVGTEAHMTHNCLSPSYGMPSSSYYSNGSNEDVPCLSFSEAGSKVAQSLICLAGLDIKTTSASKMDGTDLRFGCSACLHHNFNGVWMRFGYSWRAAIIHSLWNPHLRASTECSWSILSSSDTILVKQHEGGSEARWVASQWTCNHCSINLNNFQTRAIVLEHLRDIHQILEPKERDDLFLYERVRPGPEKVRFPTDPPPKPAKLVTLQVPVGTLFRCIHCAAVSLGAGNRLFKSDGVLAHIRDKHSIRPADTKEGVDFKKHQS